MTNKSLESLFSISFRPFFIAAAAIAFFNPLSWVFTYLGQFSFNFVHTNALFWHGHEMIFGFSGALIAGFILTASANWTGTPPYEGKHLKILLITWIIERLSYFLPVNESIFIILNNLFFPTLVLMLFLKLKSFPKQRNVFIPLLVGITLAKILNSSGQLYLQDSIELSGREMGVGLVRFLIILIAGRVLPFFTRKKIEGIEINVPKWVNLLSLIPVLLLAIPFPQSTPLLIMAVIYILAIIGNMFRQITWKPHKTIRVPILFVLHVGVMFINLALIYEFVALFVPELNATKAILHMSMAGGFGVVAIGIMSRVSLGHTGRVIKAGGLTQIMYVLITLGALVRVFVPLMLPRFYTTSLYLSSALWSGGFLLFLISYLGILISARPDGKK